MQRIKIIYTSSTVVNEKQKQWQGPALQEISIQCLLYNRYCTKHSIHFQGTGTNVGAPFYQMRKMSHSADKWGKEDLNLGFNLKPMLLPAVCKESEHIMEDRPQVIGIWGVSFHIALQWKEMEFRYPRWEYLTFPHRSFVIHHAWYMCLINIRVPPVSHRTSRNF